MKKLKSLYENQINGKKYYTFDIDVRWEELDINGHVNYSNYYNYYSEARIHAMGKELFNNLRDNKIGTAIYKADIDFHKELLYPDTAHIVTYVEKAIGRTRVSVNQFIYSLKKHELISSGKFLAIFIDMDKRKPVRIPNEIQDKIFDKTEN